MTTKHSTKQLEAARLQAQEYRRLAELGDWARADQVQRTIDELVGYWKTKPDVGRVWAWPEEIRVIAHGR
jgi:hypothetical protein